MKHSLQRHILGCKQIIYSCKQLSKKLKIKRSLLQNPQIKFSALNDSIQEKIIKQEEEKIHILSMPFKQSMILKFISLKTKQTFKFSLLKKQNEQAKNDKKKKLTKIFQKCRKKYKPQNASKNKLAGKKYNNQNKKNITKTQEFYEKEEKQKINRLTVLSKILSENYKHQKSKQLIKRCLTTFQ